MNVALVKIRTFCVGMFLLDIVAVDIDFIVMTLAVIGGYTAESDAVKGGAVDSMTFRTLECLVVE